MIQPHGGKLVNRILAGSEKTAELERASGLPPLVVDARTASDLELIATGAYSPLSGFMGRDDYESVVENMRLAGGLPWSIPITLPVSTDSARGLNGDVVLVDGSGRLLAILEVEDVFERDPLKEAELVYLTSDTKHPGVAYVLNGPTWLVSGPIHLLDHPLYELSEWHLPPAESRRTFKERGWKTVVGFQTRNPVHRAHEYIQKCALEILDGLFLHPLVGETKSDDVPADVRMECYSVLIEQYYPKDRVVLGVLPAAMRYAGPREAIHHAIVRKNYGCTHFIVGRDHAGVGDYYGTFDAHRIFDRFEAGELGITPLFFDHTFYCRTCQSMVSNKTCPHQPDSRVSLSGTKVREMLARQELPPVEFTRPEVARVLAAWAKEDED